jgi:diguanylate cyclase (GGDEF)-like protein
MKSIRIFFQSLEERLFRKEWIGSPGYEALRFSIIYISLGLIWIIWSDDILVYLVKDIELIIRIQTLKGWFYVFMTGLLFSVILKRRIKIINQLSENIVFQSTHDSLTKLPNRIKSAEFVNLKIKSNPLSIFALVNLDLDDFFNVNELLGYSVGDELIISLAKNLVKRLSTGDYISRNGDGFILILDLSNRNKLQLNQYLNTVLDIVNRERIIENQTIFITCSLGVALYPKDGSNFNDLFRASDTAMRHLKNIRKNSYNFYTEDYHTERVNRVKLINELRKSLDKDELYLLYQPIFNMSDMTVHSYEALIRWESLTFGQISPIIFIGYAENTNLIYQIDEFVFKSSLRIRRKWHELGDHTTILSINLSSKGLMDPSFMHTIERLCLEQLYIPNEIQIEITETALISNFELAKNHLIRLKRLGFIIALDDFGAGYSSLSYLHQLPIDCMKIDRSFSVNPGINNNQDLILATIIDLARKLNLKVVAEGIETDKQKDFFLSMKCILGQGYLFAYPESEEQATHRILNK